MNLLLLVILTSFPLGSSAINQSEYDRWLKYYQYDEGEFSEECAPIKLDLEWYDYFSVEDKYRSELSSFFVYSPDSSLFIDLDSYSLVVERVDGKLVSFGFGVDSKIQLIRLEDNQAAEILFCGTSCVVETAAWLSSSQLYILGFVEEGSERYYPSRWLVDLKQNIIIRTIAEKETQYEKINYREKERLKEIEFR